MRFFVTASMTLLLMCVGCLPAPRSPEGVTSATGAKQPPPDYWPNEMSGANSDDWIVENHDRIRVMRPKVLVLVFMNGWDDEVAYTEQMIKALAESTRYHGYKDADAPAFLHYEVAKYVDLRDPPGTEPLEGNSSKYPALPDGERGFGRGFAYEELFGDTFAEYYGYEDPDTPGEYLELAELIERGIVHELWYFAYHTKRVGYETVEIKQYYDENLRKKDGVYGGAGNGHYEKMPWTGRSFRITWFNGKRGVGCGTENLGHALEGMANYDFCPYYTKYFREYAGFDLDARWGLPFQHFYRYSYKREDGDQNSFPQPDVLEWSWRDKSGTVEDYYAMGGNVHWTPAGRWHYDLENDQSVYSTIEHYRCFDGPDGEDTKELWDNGKWTKCHYEDVAPDCMGRWLVYWRQNMPGLDNPCLDDDGKPMKNWWVFLFY